MPASPQLSSVSLSDRIARELRRLCVPGHLKGSGYLAYMLDRAIPDKNQLDLITKNLYPDTGQHFGVSAGSVERNVRTAICSSWKRGGQVVLEEMAEHPLGEPPTSSEFLDIVSDYIRRTS